MSGHHKFSKLTKDLSASDRKEIENIKARMRSELEAAVEQACPAEKESNPSSALSETAE